MEKAPELHQGDRTDDWGRFFKSRYKKELGEIRACTRTSARF